MLDHSAICAWNKGGLYYLSLRVPPILSPCQCCEFQERIFPPVDSKLWVWQISVLCRVGILLTTFKTFNNRWKNAENWPLKLKLDNRATELFQHSLNTHLCRLLHIYKINFLVRERLLQIIYLENCVKDLSLTWVPIS